MAVDKGIIVGQFRRQAASRRHTSRGDRARIRTTHRRSGRHRSARIHHRRARASAAARQSIPHRPCLNRADPGISADNRDAASALTAFPQLRLLDNTVGDRKAFANATGLGLSVDELKPRDRKASDELASLIRNVFTVADALQSNGGQ